MRRMISTGGKTATTPPSPPPVPPPSPRPGKYRSADPSLLPAGRRILDYLSGLTSRADKRLLSGQYHFDHCQTVAKETGKWPAILGEFFIYPHQSLPWGPKRDIGAKTRAEFLTYWQAGGLCTVTGVFSNPKTKGPNNDSNFNDNDFIAVVTEDGNSINLNYRVELDIVVGHLRWLQERGVVVLWRALVEQVQGGFWWGSRNTRLDVNPLRYKNLYHYTADYLRARGVHNCIYVFASSLFEGAGHPHGYSGRFYPGDNYTDIAGCDIYKDLDGNNQWTDQDMIASWAVRSASPDRIQAFPEYGQQNGAEPQLHTDYRKLLLLKKLFPMAVYWQSWSYQWSMRAENNTHVKELLDDPWVVTRDELPYFRG